MKSIFVDKNVIPTSEELQKGIGATYQYWELLSDYTKQIACKADEEWNFSGEKFGWSFRVKDKKRVLIYLLPRDCFFKIAFVFGQKAMDKIMESSVSEVIKNELIAAKVYSEGRGIRIEVRDESFIEDLKKLIEIKILT